MSDRTSIPSELVADVAGAACGWSWSSANGTHASYLAMSACTSILPVTVLQDWMSRGTTRFSKKCTRRGTAVLRTRRGTDMLDEEKGRTRRK